MNFHKINDDCYDVITEHAKKKIGQIIKGDDGYFMFFLDNYNGGGFPEYILREVAQKLFHLNEPWDREVTMHFNAKA